MSMKVLLYNGLPSHTKVETQSHFKQQTKKRANQFFIVLQRMQVSIGKQNKKLGSKVNCEYLRFQTSPENSKSYRNK